MSTLNLLFVLGNASFLTVDTKPSSELPKQSTSTINTFNVDIASMNMTNPLCLISQATACWCWSTSAVYTNITEGVALVKSLRTACDQVKGQDVVMKVQSQLECPLQNVSLVYTHS